MIPMPSLSAVHRLRWQNVGQYLQRLYGKSVTGPTTTVNALTVEELTSVVLPKESSPITTLATDLDRPPLSQDHLPAAVPQLVFSVDLKKEVAKNFFQQLSWTRRGTAIAPQPHFESAPTSPSRPQISGARQYFSSLVPWKGRGTLPVPGKIQQSLGPSALKNLITAATENALHQAKRYADKPQRPSFSTNNTSVFFQNLPWNHTINPKTS
jgi:hypothetical protein